MSCRETVVRLLILVLLPLSTSIADEARRIPAGQRQLFLDDEAIARIENLKRTLHQPTKRGAVIRSSNPTQTIQTRAAPVWDPAEKQFRLWVMSTDQPLRQSRDRLHWIPGPQLNLRIDHAVYDPRDPDPGRRFKAALLNEGFAVSPDGVQWTKLDVPAVPAAMKATSVTIRKKSVHPFGEARRAVREIGGHRHEPRFQDVARPRRRLSCRRG